VKKLAVLMLSTTIAVACGGPDEDRGRVASRDEPGPDDTVVSEDIGADLRELARSRIYFGRHSVGRNMLSGLELLAAEHGIDGIHVVDLDAESAVGDTFLVHSRIGENMSPRTKVDGFARRLRGGLPAKPDVAFMKFCYVDFDPNSDVPALFDYYRSTLDRLGEELPDMRLLHATVPLMARERDVKSRIKLLLGRPLWGDEANGKRQEFNELLAQTYDADLIVDIARAESTHPDGTREQFEKNGRVYYSLNPAYTTDGGHLNEAGQRRVAAEMVRVLARNLRQEQRSPASSELR
jgi:hypothetical protein